MGDEISYLQSRVPALSQAIDMQVSRTPSSAGRWSLYNDMGDEYLTR